MWFFEMWAGLNTWLKVGVALVFLLISTLLWFSGTFWPWGWVVGVLLLIFSLPNDAQRKGYHDFGGVDRLHVDESCKWRFNLSTVCFA